MSMMFLAALMMAQAPAAVQPVAPPQQVKKVKPKQVCEEIEVTGSRSRRRVCHDVNGAADLSGYGVSNSLAGKGKSDSAKNGTPTSTMPPG